MHSHRNLNIPIRVLTSTLLSGLLVACDSGNQSSSSAAPTSDRVITRGAVTALDTVSVNGRAFSVSNASIFLDDQMVDKSALRTGMQVIVQRQNGAATNVNYEEDVKGPVDTVDATGNMFVMGQSVVVSADTVFDDSSDGAIATGDIVEVSGLRDNTGTLYATYVDKKQSMPDAFEVQGPIAQLSTTDQTFVIGDLVISYAAARFDDLSESSLSNGLFVEVEDSNRLYEPGSMFLLATEIDRYQDVLSVSSNSSSSAGTLRTEIEIEAFVTEIVSDSVFQMGSQVVRILPTTRFRDGDQQQLQVNTRLEVEGRLNSNGEIEAWEIEFEDGSDYYDSDDDDSDFSSDSDDDDNDNRDDDENEVELEGIVTAMNAEEGLLVINGIEIRVDNRTEFENGQDQYITRSQFFGLIDIGRTVVKVEWDRFTSYNDAPHEVEIEI